MLPLCQFDCPSDRSSTQAPCIHAINTMFITNPSITIDCSLFQVFHSNRNEIRWDTWYDKLIIYLLHVFILSMSISDVNLTTFRSSIVCDKYFRKKELCKLVISDIFMNLLNLTYDRIRISTKSKKIFRTIFFPPCFRIIRIKAKNWDKLRHQEFRISGSRSD